MLIDVVGDEVIESRGAEEKGGDSREGAGSVVAVVDDAVVDDAAVDEAAVGEVATTGELDVIDADGDEGVPVAEPPKILGYWTYNGIAMQLVDGVLHGSVSLNDSHAGRPGWASGGVVANLFDELLLVALAPHALDVRSSRIEVDFLAPVPLHERITLSAWVSHREGRRVYTAASLHLGARVLAQAMGAYFVVGARATRCAPR